MIQEMESDTEIDIVELPPDRVDQLTNEEKIDEDKAGENFVEPRDVLGGMVEIQIRKPFQENDTPPPPKRIKTNWKKTSPYSKFHSTIDISSGDMYDKALFESNLGSKSSMEIFEILTEGLF